MAFSDWQTNALYFLRWFHIMAGITWIGHLYFFNFVNVPFQGALPKELKPQVNPQLIHRALWWFRWGAMWTFVVGWLLLLLKYGHGGLMYEADGALSDRFLWILFGGTLGSIMWFNVWFVIWPAQKQLLAWTKAAQSPPEMPALGKRALLFSRINTYLSGPMLFCMIAPNNYPTINAVSVVVVTVFGLGAVWLLIKLSPKVGMPPA